MCESGVGEDAEHLLVWRFDRDWRVLADEKNCRNCESSWRNTSRVRWHCCWKKMWREGLSDIVMEEVGECIMYWIGE